MNLEIVRSIYAAWERGDFGSADWAHPEVEFVIADGPEPGSWTGVGGMTEGVRSIASAWEDLRGEAEECRELDDERVLVLTRRSGRGKPSSLELGRVRSKSAQVFHIRGGRVTRLVLTGTASARSLTSACLPSLVP